MSDFQQILLRDLPLATGTAAPYTFVAVDGNRNSVRVPASVLTSASVMLSPSAPTSLSAEGTEGSLAFSCPSLYSYYNGQWGASPRYTKNIEDLDANTRFLLVNKEMSLTQEEKDAVTSSLGISVASTNSAGLVFGSSPEKEGMVGVTVEEGHMYVRNATAVDNGVVTTTGEEGPVTTKEYVDTQIEGLNRELVIPVATTGTIGGVLSGGDGDIFTVSDTGAVTIRQADAGGSVPGIVTVASANIDTQLDSVVPLRLLRSVVNDITVGTVPYATYTSAGIVKVAGTKNGPYGPLHFKDAYGTLDIYTATDARYGVVKTLSNIPLATTPEQKALIPTTGAVQSYVQTIFTGDDDGGGGGVLPPSSIPMATTGTLGGIIVGSRMTINPSGVLNPNAAVPGASDYGVVRVVATLPETAAGDEAETVPTTQAVRSYITSVALEGSGGTINPANLPKATSSTLGAVRVGSRLTINTSTGEINVNSATTSRAGIAQLSNSYTSTSQSLAVTPYALNSLRSSLTTWMNDILTCINGKIDTLSDRVDALEGN